MWLASYTVGPEEDMRKEIPLRTRRAGDETCAKLTARIPFHDISILGHENLFLPGQAVEELQFGSTFCRGFPILLFSRHLFKYFTIFALIREIFGDEVEF